MHIYLVFKVEDAVLAILCPGLPIIFHDDNKYITTNEQLIVKVVDDNKSQVLIIYFTQTLISMMWLQAVTYNWMDSLHIWLHCNMVYIGK